MTTEKSLYILLKENKLIKEEIYDEDDLEKLARHDIMNKGYLWRGELKIITHEGLIFIFCTNHHCKEDIGGSWYPSQNELDEMWQSKFVPTSRSPDSKLSESFWHLLIYNNHAYISTQGTLNTNFSMRDFTNCLKNESWKQNPNIWCII